MLEVFLHSPDPKMYPLLASALKPDCAIVSDNSLERLKQAAHSAQPNVLVLDFDSNYYSRAQQLAIYDSIADSRSPVVVMTDDLRPSTVVEFIQRGAFDYIRKPPSLLEFKVVVRRAHEHLLMKIELERMRETLNVAQRCDALVGSSAAAQTVYELIRKVADLKASVLITGESGTGKELVARAVHNLGCRSRHPFVAVSCGAIPETLIEAELFGHDKGAFTGSAGARAGYFEEAGEGTLFLDEIGELSLNTQVKLLRVLQQKEFSRLGSNRLIPLKARVIFATHRNLQQMVGQNTFRQDLFFRVNVVSIPVPPLRERPEDIPALARHFLKKYSEEYEKTVCDIRPNAMELLSRYDWPGNIRELENVIQGAVIMTDGETVTTTDLPDHLRPADELEGRGEEPPADSFEDLLRQFKISLANKAISDCNGNKSLAARKLRVSRAYLHRLIRVGPETIDAA